MKKHIIFLTIWELIVSANVCYAQGTTAITSLMPPVGNAFYLKLQPHTLTTPCTVGTLAIDLSHTLYICKGSSWWVPAPSVWTQDDGTKTVYLTNPTGLNLGVAIGTNTKQLQLTVGDGSIGAGGIIADGIADITIPPTLTNPTGAVTRLIWYSQKSAFRAGSAYGDEWTEPNIGPFSVAFGRDNKAMGYASFVGSGWGNIAAGGPFFGQAAVVGGSVNKAIGPLSFIGGGANNEANGGLSVVGGGGGFGVGAGNKANGGNATIGGGYGNVIDINGWQGTIAGGIYNQISTNAAVTIGGGNLNQASGRVSTIAGGEKNQATGDGTTVGGGTNNKAYGKGTWETGDPLVGVTTVAGGYNNRAGGLDPPYYHPGATVGGGANNNADGDYSTIIGGLNNNATGNNSSILGGSSNSAGGLNSTVLGGVFNTANGAYALAGGENVEVVGSRSVGLGQNLGVSGSNAFVFAHYETRTDIPWRNTFAVLSTNTAIGHQTPSSFPATLDTKLTVWSDPANSNNVAVHIRDLMRLQGRRSPPTTCDAAGNGNGLIYNDSDGALCYCHTGTWYVAAGPVGASCN